MQPSGGKPDNGKKKQRGHPPKKRLPVPTLFAPSTESSSSSQASPTTSVTTATFTLAHPLVSSKNEDTATTSGQSSPTTTFATTPTFTLTLLNVAPENATATGKLSNTTTDLFNNNNVDFNTSGGIINGEKETQQEEDEHNEISREQQRNKGNDKILAGTFQPIVGGKENTPGRLFDQIPSVLPPFFGAQTGAPSQQCSGSIVFSNPSTSLDTSTFGSSLADLSVWGSRPTQDAEDSVFTSPGSLKPSTQCTATLGSNASAFPLTQEPQIPSAKCDGSNTPLSPSISTLEVPAPSSNGTEDSQNNLESTDDVHMADEASASITAEAAISLTTETQQTSEHSKTSPQLPSAQLNATQEPVLAPLPPVIGPLSPQCTLPAPPSQDPQNLSLSHNNTSTTSTNASGHNWDNDTFEHQRSTEDHDDSGRWDCSGEGVLTFKDHGLSLLVQFPTEGNIWWRMREFQHGRIVIMMLWNGASACTEVDISGMEADISGTEAIIFGTTSMHSAMRLARKS
ncbi:hypothetical protein Pelo_18564 [Pelomyxa schiedti]|nr:hypothetical protein Pelo_18564 [Pelomyxa schiedti]